MLTTWQPFDYHYDINVYNSIFTAFYMCLFKNTVLVPLSVKETSLTLLKDLFFISVFCPEVCPHHSTSHLSNGELLKTQGDESY